PLLHPLLAPLPSKLHDMRFTYIVGFRRNQVFDRYRNRNRNIFHRKTGAGTGTGILENDRNRNETGTGTGIPKADIKGHFYSDQPISTSPEKLENNSGSLK